MPSKPGERGNIHSAVSSPASRPAVLTLPALHAEDEGGGRGLSGQRYQQEGEKRPWKGGRCKAKGVGKRPAGGSVEGETLVVAVAAAAPKCAIEDAGVAGV